MNLRNLNINFNHVSFRGLPDLLIGEAHAILVMVCLMDNPPTLLVNASPDYSNKLHFSYKRKRHKLISH
ncbi:hypothetical protein JHK82_029743 [Glycine max]|uniref:Uncharacterized protein n=2 Tax=Glycine subgen. Soja TaxID=1462606 RepID=A0A0R0HJW4_SOYBN|nr:hypothetical protein JHK87_029622 [Glycine soja]KAG4987369.1 hypothetical protein JHK85_030352 [Glycine max]KAG4992997.1 hypothetical protein JHK86_029824 [Glycine max]KAG5123006.1 hypothetical protein JHK82_029743 [Glycine max]KAG5144420.1 hypothetical protein JHK84_029963 [Glycine max]